MSNSCNGHLDKTQMVFYLSFLNYCGYNTRTYFIVLLWIINKPRLVENIPSRSWFNIFVSTMIYTDRLYSSLKCQPLNWVHGRKNYFPLSKKWNISGRIDRTWISISDIPLLFLLNRHEFLWKDKNCHGTFTYSYPSFLHCIIH